jgi:tetratricopeptide (TPR) repeat protein
MNDFTNAARFYRNALDTYKKIGIRQYICYTSNNLGELKFWLGEYEEAKKLFEDQLTIATELGIKRHVSIAYNCLGNICRKQDSFEQAEDYYNKAISIGEELNVQTILCEYYYEKASLFFEMKRFDESLELAEKAVKMSTEVNRQDFRFRSELLKWRIVSISEPQTAIENIQRMIVENIKEENLAEVEFLLFILTKDEKHYEKALSLFEALYKLAPKAAYKERIESLLSEK